MDMGGYRRGNSGAGLERRVNARYQAAEQLSLIACFEGLTVPAKGHAIGTW